MAKLVLIDGNSILNRAFYGILSNRMLTTPDGKYTNAVYGFLSILFKVMEELNPKYIAVAFDLKAPTARHKMYEGYKANRKGMPEEKEKIKEEIPLEKIGTAENIAKCIKWLIEDDYVTGEVISINGGWYM